MLRTHTLTHVIPTRMHPPPFICHVRGTLHEAINGTLHEAINSIRIGSSKCENLNYNSIHQTNYAICVINILIYEAHTYHTLERINARKAIWIDER